MFLTDTICIVIQEEEVLGPISVQFAEHAGEESAQHSVMLQCPINDTATPCEQCTACSGMPEQQSWGESFHIYKCMGSRLSKTYMCVLLDIKPVKSTALNSAKSFFRVSCQVSFHS